jgi:outer membrane protein assembly factor BamB
MKSAFFNSLLTCLAVFMFCVSFCVSTGVAEKLPERYWPTWRGPQDMGSTESGSYIAEFDNNKNVQWKIELPGRGCSTPVVWGDHILVTCPQDDVDTLMSLDWSGKIRWQTNVEKLRAGKHRNGSSCNPSPVTDGQFIFTYFKNGTLAGLDFSGALLWKTNLQQRWGKDTLYWDLGTSPVLTNDHVVVAVMHKGESYLVAFDKETGDLAWRVLRNYKTPVEGDHSYATPHVIERDGKQIIVVWGAEHLTAHDAADGKKLWECGGFNPDENGNWVVVASSVLSGDMALIPYGRGSRLAGIKLGGEGDVTSTNRVWTRENTGTFVPTPVVANGKLYMVRDKGEVECVDPKTGETIWVAAFPKNRNKFYASPVIADGKIFAPREDGVILVGTADGDFKVLSENDMGERVIASPVPVGSRMLIRGEQHLFCIGK